MKIKSDFVTNSSSSSYVVSLCKNFNLQTTDEKLKPFIEVLSKEFQNLFEQLHSYNDDYDIHFICTYAQLVEYILDKSYCYATKCEFEGLITYKKEQKIVNVDKLKNAIDKLINKYDKEQYKKYMHEISKGNTICIMKSSHHNYLMCALMDLITNSPGATFIQSD